MQISKKLFVVPALLSFVAMAGCVDCGGSDAEDSSTSGSKDGGAQDSAQLDGAGAADTFGLPDTIAPDTFVEPDTWAAPDTWTAADTWTAPDTWSAPADAAGPDLDFTPTDGSVEEAGYGIEDFAGGCYDITAAEVEDSCLNPAATIPAPLLNAINTSRSNRGLTNLSNPVDVSALYETGMETLLTDLYPAFPLDPIDPTELAAGTITLEIPNPYAADVDDNGEVGEPAMMTLTCTVSGNVASCTLEDLEVDLSEVITDQLAAGDMAADNFTCTVTLDIAATVTYVSENVVQYLLAVTVTPDGSCAVAVQALFENYGVACTQSFDLTAEYVGEIAPDAGYCAQY